MSLILVLISVLLYQEQAAGATLSPLALPASGAVETCPSQERRDAAILNISTSARNILDLFNANCGEGLWYRVAYLNMSDPSQQCPSTWREYGANGSRLCRRPETSSGSCLQTSYVTGRQYSKVCGRVYGYQVGSTDAFSFLAKNNSIDSYYVYGVSVTHGVPRNHIWTFAAGVSEGDYVNQDGNCPCSDPSDPSSLFPPTFVGDNYYCESGNPADTFIEGHLYSDDLLWDGQQCEGQCCGNGNSPPWFSSELQSKTIDDIDVRICIPQPSSEDIAIQLVELYVQ